MGSPKKIASRTHGRVWSSGLAFVVAHRGKGDVSVYTLKLADDNYYMGFSDDVPRRIAEHFLGRGTH